MNCYRPFTLTANLSYADKILTYNQPTTAERDALGRILPASRRSPEAVSQQTAPRPWEGQRSAPKPED